MSPFPIAIGNLLLRSGAATELGPDACWLLSVVALKQDEKRLSGPAAFWNSQLAEACGFASNRRLVRVRTAAIEAGWLRYESQGRRRPGLYEVVVPEPIRPLLNGAKSKDSTEVLEGAARFQAPFKRRSSAVQAGAEEVLEGAARFQAPFKRRSSAAQPGALLPIPNPNPNPSSCLGCSPDALNPEPEPKPEPPKRKTRGKRKPTFSEEDLATARWFWERILQIQPTRKPPKLENWANSIRLIREQDGKTIAQIRELFTKVQADEFWRLNVLSPDKLRAKWDDLELRLTGKPQQQKSIYRDLTPGFRPRRNGKDERRKT